MQAMQMFIANVWIKKIWYIHAMGYHSALEKGNPFIYETTWIKL